jgi:chloride channel protein, CIC family
LGLLLGLVFLKILATGFTISSGGSGGVFGPSIMIGGMLGTACEQLLGN